MNRMRLGKKIEVLAFSITPVERIEVSVYSNRYGLGFYGECKPLGLLVESGDKRWAIDIKGDPVSVEEFSEASST